MFIKSWNERKSIYGGFFEGVLGYLFFYNENYKFEGLDRLRK